MKKSTGPENKIDQIVTIYEHHLTPEGIELLKGRKPLLEEIAGGSGPDELCPFPADFSI